MRNFRQALASPYPGLLAGFTIRARPPSCSTGGVMTKIFRPLAAITLVAALAAGCAARSVRIAELKNELDRYDDKTVTITGVVTSSYGIPLVPFQVYNLDDGSGE